MNGQNSLEVSLQTLHKRLRILGMCYDLISSQDSHEELEISEIASSYARIV